MSPDLKLSANFSLGELVRSEAARKLGLSNMPTAEHLQNLRELCRHLELVRHVINRPLHITSAYRSPAVNAAVGGTHSSAHPMGYAADLVVDGLTPAELARSIRDTGCHYDQLILESSRGVVHYSVDPRMRQMAGEQKGGPGTLIVWRLPLKNADEKF